MFDIVLHEPEIPNNTGNIGRTCVATGCRLRLIEPLGFDIDEKACRRAGLDYWPRLDLDVHSSYEDYCLGSGGARRWLFSARADRLLFDADLRPGDHLMFGKESAGLPDEIVAANLAQVVRLPLVAGERSLNLSGVVCAAIFEGLRQCRERGELELDADLGLPAANPRAAPPVSE